MILPTGIILDVKNKIDGADGTNLFSAIYDNAQQLQCNPIQADVTQNNISAYLNSIGGVNYNFVLYSGVPRQHGTITKGLISSTQRYNLAFQPDYSGVANSDIFVPSGTPKGKFANLNAFNSANASAVGVNKFTNLTYKFSTDGKAQPQSKKIDLGKGSISGTITEDIYTNINQVSGYGNFQPTEIKGNLISTNFFDRENPISYYAPVDAFSPPTSASTTNPPETTNPPSTTSPPDTTSPVTTTLTPINTTENETTTTTAPPVQPVTRAWVGTPSPSPSFVCPT